MAIPLFPPKTKAAAWVPAPAEKYLAIDMLPPTLHAPPVVGGVTGVCPHSSVAAVDDGVAPPKAKAAV